jgi:hypothetical protein
MDSTTLVAPGVTLQPDGKRLAFFRLNADHTCELIVASLPDKQVIAHWALGPVEP